MHLWFIHILGMAISVWSRRRKGEGIMIGPEDVEGECNARLFIADDFGDNTCTMRCSLPAGHEGYHQEAFERDNGNKVVTSWTVNEAGTEDDPNHILDGDFEDLDDATDVM